LSKLCSAQYHVSYTPVSKSIYKDILDLKLDSAKIKLDQFSKVSPNNLARVHLENYLDFFELFINEDKSRFDVLEKNKEGRLKLIDKLEDSDPYKLFVKAEINLQWALSRSKFDQLYKAGREVLSAYKDLETNSERHPSFIYNKKSLSIIHSLIETITIPGIVKKFLGMEGSIELGLEEILDVINYSYQSDFIFTEEADAIYTYILFYQNNQKEKAWDYIQNSSLNPETSPLAAFLIAKIAQRSGRNEKAIQLLENTAKGDGRMPFYYLDLLLGVSQLRQLNPECRTNIQSYLSNFKGQHFIKEAYQKLAWADIVFDNNYNGYLDKMRKLKDSGTALVDDDKQAQKESKSLLIPNKTLLEARLLYDGGYFEKAHRLLTKNASHFRLKEKHTLEFNYRIGRTAQALQNYPEAIKYLSNTINNGWDQPEYYACNAALQIAYMFESQNEWEKARKYFNLCLSLEPEEYTNSLHQKAKTGLDRINERK